MTYGYCVYHEIECDYKGSCIDCPRNTEEDAEWFKQDEERAESEEYKVNIIEHGKKYHKATCPLCKCKFGYLDRDITVLVDHETSWMSEINAKYVTCPECFESLFITYQGKRRGEDWKDVKPDMLTFI